MYKAHSAILLHWYQNPIKYGQDQKTGGDILRKQDAQIV